MVEPMAEMAGYDKHRWWDKAYSQPDPLPDPPELKAQAQVAVLRDLAGDGPVLELAVGAGRVAIPLAATGVEVDGIDFSANAIEQLRAEPQGGVVNASVADLSDFAMGRKYQLIYCIANSLFNVEQEGQVRCFELVAAHLAPGGVFLVESGYAPGWFESHLRNGQYVEARHFELNFAFFQALRVDPVDQVVYQQNMYLSKDGIAFSPQIHRFSSLGELDLMARIAGLQRRDLWGGWTRQPYGAASQGFVVTYGAR
jgi:SAM-dependent methyltransferase